MSAERSEIPVALDLDAAIERMGAELLKALVDEVRNAPAQWQKLTKTQQDMLIDRLRSTVRRETDRAVQLIAKGKRKSATVVVESLTVKDGAKAALKLVDGIHDVVDYVGRSAVLALCDPAQYLKGIENLKGDDEQKGLELVGGGKEGGAPDPIAEVEAEDAEERLEIDVDEDGDDDEQDGDPPPVG